jgi:hypothetical protein
MIFSVQFENEPAFDCNEDDFCNGDLYSVEDMQRLYTLEIGDRFSSVEIEDPAGSKRFTVRRVA